MNTIQRLADRINRRVCKLTGHRWYQPRPVLPRFPTEVLITPPRCRRCGISAGYAKGGPVR